MKLRLTPCGWTFCFATMFLGIPFAGRAQAVTETAVFQPNLEIPDNSTLGLADTRLFTSSIFSISNVRISLKIEGAPGAGDAFNGDFYAYLTHGSGFAVLLNRVGRTGTDDFGYADSGFDVVFDDSGSSPDIHRYLTIANPAGQAIAGLFSSDGRNIHPTQTLESTPRSAFLTSFNGLDPNGDWTLFLADVSPTGQGRVTSWTLEITGAVPEPGTTALLILGCAALQMRRRRCSS